MTAPTRPRHDGRRWQLRLPNGWPLTALFVLYPLWWALGLDAFIFDIVAVPMAFQLIRRGRIRVPAGFGIWLVLLFWVVLSGLMLGVTAPGTVPPHGFGRYLAWALRTLDYLSATTVMLYVLNLDRGEENQRRTVRLMGFLAVVTIVGGYVGALVPQLRFTAPLKHLLPHAIASDHYVAQLMLVEVAQVQDVLGGGKLPRPSAPFEFTNTWGENLAILLIWLVVGWVAFGGYRRRRLGYLLLVAALFPIVYSLNRGLWIGLGIAVGYVAVRLALRGRTATLAGLALAASLAGLAVLATPLGDTIAARARHGHSNEIRSTLNARTVAAANYSPILGYGGNRALIGANKSIAIGKSANCRQCGNRELGSDGQFWTNLVGQGWPAVLCYNGFFLYALWRYRRDHSVIGIAGSLVIVLMLFFQFLYGALPTTLAYGLISVALLARNDGQVRAAHRRLVEAAVRVPRQRSAMPQPVRV